MGTLERGFKSWAERTSLAFRRELGLEPEEQLRPEILADHLNIAICRPTDIDGLPEEIIHQLRDEDPWGWSAVSFGSNGQNLVIYNPRKSNGRRASDITHELAHFILNHEPAKIILSIDLDIGMRSFDQKQEDEANWLAWSLLLPRDGLVQALKRGSSVEKVAQDFGVTESLVNMRMRLTGVESQLRATNRFRRK